MGNSRYAIPSGRATVEDEIKRSRFITTLDRADDPDSARALIAEMREAYADARHHCYAFLVGPPGSTGTVGMSDDGEPHGTAGRPMLNVLVHSGLGDVVAVVTRYYGGTQLGRGGLLRAYSSGVQYALSEVGRVEKVELATVSLRFNYTYVEQIKRLLPDHEAALVHEDYGAEAAFRIDLPTERVEELTRVVQNLTNGMAQIG